MHEVRWVLLGLFTLVTYACGSTPADSPALPEEEVPISTLLGDVTAEARYTIIADASDGLDVPRDLGFHPERLGELWIVNRGDESIVIVSGATGDSPRPEKRIDGYALHFMADVSSVAFGAKNYRDDFSFGTCQESENTYHGQARPNFFMGPALWSANLDVFAIADPMGLGSHLDMLHHSPDCMGIAHEDENVYWVFDGYHGQLVRYDFQQDHDAGFDDHSDGIITFLDEPRVSRVPDVPSHMELDRETGALYVADTGNARVIRVNTAKRRFSRSLVPIEPGTEVEEWTGAPWSEFVPASTGLLRHPSGLALHRGLVYVGDNATGELFAFRPHEEGEGAELVARLSTGLEAGALMGIEVGPDERLYLVDATGLVLRLER